MLLRRDLSCGISSSSSSNSNNNNNNNNNFIKRHICYIRWQRIFWTKHRTNDWVLEKLPVEKELLGKIKTHKNGILWNDEKTPQPRKTSGSRMHRRREKSGTSACRRWTADISEWTRLNINDAARVAEDREPWRKILYAANSSALPYGGRHCIDDDEA